MAGGCKIIKNNGRYLAIEDHGRGDVLLDLHLDHRPLFYLRTVDRPNPELSSLASADEFDQCFAVSRAQSETTNTLLLWHQRMGHRNFPAVCRILGISAPKFPFCRACVEGKLTRYPFSSKPHDLCTLPRDPHIYCTLMFSALFAF